LECIGYVHPTAHEGNLPLRRSLACGEGRENLL
jgi:hypothetical protein